MKKALCTLLCLAVCAALAACGAQPQSGAAPALPAASSSAAAGTASSSAPASGAQSGASLPAGSSGAASAPSSSSAPGRAQSVTATLADGSGSVALALPVPENWQLDGYTTWMEDGRKVLELGSVWKLPVYSDTAAPFTTMCCIDVTIIINDKSTTTICHIGIDFFSFSTIKELKNDTLVLCF